ncbi:MAG: DUF4114 domain-containing protein [Spirulina sp. SIO3F2]|nr:DUF4114 domain-containing protein [Spirulina sp. SIO3F2]
MGNRKKIKLTLPAVDDTVVELTETVALTVLDQPTDIVDPSAKTVPISTIANDLPSVRLEALDAAATENGDPGVYRLSRNSNLGSLTVRFAIAPQSTASLDEIDLLFGSTIRQLSATDYEVTFAEGTTVADITLIPQDDNLGERQETVVLELQQSSDYFIDAGTAAVAIAASDLPVIRITAPTQPQTEGENQTFTVALSNPSSQTVTVAYTTVEGSADEQDYTGEQGQLTFAPGELSQTLTIATQDDAAVEGEETFAVRLLAAIDALVDPNQGEAQGIIIDNDAASEPVNDSLVNQLPQTRQSLRQGESLVFSAENENLVAIAAPDPQDKLRVALSVQGGTLSLANLDGLTFSRGDGKDDAQLNVAGMPEAINRALNGLRFTPDDQFSGTAQLQILSETTDPLNLQRDQDSLAFDVLPPEPTSILTRHTGNWFGVNGAESQTFKLTLAGQNTASINELGMFQVDNAQGEINGIAPGRVGYAEAAIARSRVVLSALSQFSDNLFPGLATTRHLAVDGGSYWGFYLVSNGTTDTVKTQIAQGQTPKNVAFGFANGGRLQIDEVGEDVFTLNFDDGRDQRQFNDLQVTLTPSFIPLPIGTNLQDRSQGELLDLRGQTGFQAATFRNFKEAGYNNSLGFYVVDNEAGYVDNLAPGDAGYAAAALARRVDYSQGFAGGQLFAPYLVANTTPEVFLAFNPTNRPGGGVYAYFAYLGANPDRIDHVRLLGDNTFAFEDLYGGGDLDYNDAVIQINFV